ncbi:hypothetical protein AB4Z22_39585, partial [Paenibacillus sp. TAF58]
MQSVRMNKEPGAVSAPLRSDGGSLTAYRDYAYVLERIQYALGDKYGHQFEPYLSDDGKEEYWELLEQDVKTGSSDVQFVTRIFDHMESRAFGIDEESDAASYRTFRT